MAPKLAQLSDEDLHRWRLALADYELAMAAHPSMPYQEARSALVSYYQVFEGLKAQYLDADDLEDLVTIGAIHGDIRLDEERE